MSTLFSFKTNLRLFLLLRLVLLSPIGFHIFCVCFLSVYCLRASKTNLHHILINNIYISFSVSAFVGFVFFQQIQQQKNEFQRYQFIQKHIFFLELVINFHVMKKKINSNKQTRSNPCNLTHKILNKNDQLKRVTSTIEECDANKIRASIKVNRRIMLIFFWNNFAK